MDSTRTRARSPHQVDPPVNFKTAALTVMMSRYLQKVHDSTASSAENKPSPGDLEPKSNVHVQEDSMEDNSCEKCEEREGDIICSCGARFCDPCFTKSHLKRNPTHQRKDRDAETAWNWIKGKSPGQGADSQHFIADEDAKWFGLSAEKTSRGNHAPTIFETARLRDLIESSLGQPGSPRRQFPSIVSFVGETGAGKSTLVRSLIYHSKKPKDNGAAVQAPVPGADSGTSAIFSTTGEVNLYLDPVSFGSESPAFYADCEGLMGTEPVSALHQKEWTKHAKPYKLATMDDGRYMDRRTAVQTLYPRFLYIFSDVVCYVTRNPKAWADSALRLLEWSMAGAESTINQHALPALIIVLNGPTIEDEEWIHGSPEAVTDAFFKTIEEEISANEKIKNFANFHGTKNMKDLFRRSYSTVYVHYVPLQGYLTLGSSSNVVKQTMKLGHRIRADALRVQLARADSWARFDTRQLSVIVEFAFRHLTSNKHNEPFDFRKCRRRITVPTSAEEHFSEILGRCLEGMTTSAFVTTAQTLGSSLLRHALHEDTSAPLVPDGVFNSDIRALCERAVSQYLDANSQCAFVDFCRRRCVNTKMGHAQGHQDITGRLLQPGLFVTDAKFNAEAFLGAVETAINDLMSRINAKSPPGRQAWRYLAAAAHRKNLEGLRNLGAFPHSETGPVPQDDFMSEFSVCYGCFFGRPEYRLPCNHVICEKCVEDFDDTPRDARYPGLSTHNGCVVCGAKDEGWPYKAHTKPNLAGVRALSLDGGGVRAIVELSILHRLERLVGLDIPLGRLFDFMVGTSAGGIIAIGLGVQGRMVHDCLRSFRIFTSEGFKSKTLTTKRGVGMVARMFRSSMYHTQNLVQALENALGPSATEPFFGLRHSCRVAVTTVVNKELRLIANYNSGGKDAYLDSKLPLWLAARCTSAAPMYFRSADHNGQECWDGGLRANNPLCHAQAEPQSIWGTAVGFDLLLSVGSGCADTSQKHHTTQTKHPWLRELLQTLLSTMDAENVWKDFRTEPRIKNRAERLNVEFEGSVAPALDDKNSVPSMEEEAWNFPFHNDPKGEANTYDFAPLSGKIPVDKLACIAVRLRASMFFFEMERIEMKNGLAHFHGWICCRIGPDESGFGQLMKMTKGFDVAGRKIKCEPATAATATAPLKLVVYFHESERDNDDIVRIDVDFGENYVATISGFPMTVKSLLDHGKAYIDPYPTLSMDECQKSAEKNLEKDLGPSLESPTAITPPPPYQASLEPVNIVVGAQELE
ncbi:Putative calcium-independent phospholipase A2 [Podospora comata]|uniref:Calcium-independent phospholipase A2 n=1 Tax=Podospora comata TaxID=48703 RepID=A0ABY6SC55_PODCO|nr:Putative calcium-independent phospholipase A2 [Podospora comata]